jgi:hypothetical protein
MSVESLVARAVSCLSDDLRRPPWRGSDEPLAGHCYVACEALYHLGLREQGWRPARARYGTKKHETHWILVNRTDFGELEWIDPTRGQFLGRWPLPPYCEFREGGFLTREPSARARELMRRMGRKS